MTRLGSTESSALDQYPSDLDHLGHVFDSEADFFDVLSDLQLADNTTFAAATANATTIDLEGLSFSSTTGWNVRRDRLMTRTSSREAAATLLLLLCAFIGYGCSSGIDVDARDVSDAASTTTSAETVQPESSASSSVPSVTAAGAESSDDATLLAELYSLLGVQTDDELLAFLSTNIPQSDVARCMSEAGFQYIEGPTPDEEAAFNLQSQLSADEFAATYGFGIAASDLGLMPQIEADPNSGYVGSLTKGQQDAYYQAYLPCAGGTPERIAYSNALNAATAQFRDAIAADDRVVESLAMWSACLAAAGFIYDTPLRMRESIYDRLNSGINHDELEQLLVDEIALATANVSCEAAHTSAYRDVVLERFDEYKKLLDSALASGAAPDAQG